MDGIPLGTIPSLTLHEETNRESIDLTQIVTAWLAKLEELLKSKSFDDIPNLFIEDCWWRDIVGLSWDFTSKHGHAAIRNYLATAVALPFNLQCTKTGGLKPFLVDTGAMIWVQAGYTFETRHGVGPGFVRLANVGKEEWKAWIVFSQLESLHFQKELDAQRVRNPAMTRKFHYANGGESSTASTQQSTDNLQVLIVGAGQAGLALGARLKSMGINAILVDKQARLGDSWRARYKSVTLHTPTFTDHYPFLKLPDNWPRYLTRDSIADFAEHYGQIMGLDVLLNSEVVTTQYDAAAQRYNVELRTAEGSKTLHPRHVVLATGVFSDEPIVPEIPGRDSFKGEVYHSSKHRSADETPDLQNKRVVVVGPGTSGHDVAQDFVSHGAKEVSMIQRHPIFSFSSEAFETIQLSLWNLEGINTEEADLIGNSIPLAVIRRMSIDLTKIMYEHDKTLLDGLTKAGLALRNGDDGYGLADHQIIKGGHFYIDQGASDMIVDGRIKIHRCEGGVKEFQADGVALDDGTKLSANVVVLATGYHRNIQTVKRLMGEYVAAKMGDEFGLLDHEQERSGWWRQTGVPGFWYMTGSFLWCRQFSLPLALQIAAIEKGLNEDYYKSEGIKV